MSTLIKFAAATAISTVLSACNSSNHAAAPTETIDGVTYSISNAATGGVFHGNTLFKGVFANDSAVTVIGGTARFSTDQSADNLNISADTVIGSKFSGDDLTIEATLTTANLLEVSGKNPDVSTETGLFIQNVNSTDGTYSTRGGEAGDVIGVTSTPGFEQTNTFITTNMAFGDGTGSSKIIASHVSAKHVSDDASFQQVNTLTVGSAETPGSIACSATFFNNASEGNNSEVIFDHTVYPVPKDGEVRSFANIGPACF